MYNYHLGQRFIRQYSARNVEIWSPNIDVELKMGIWSVSPVLKRINLKKRNYKILIELFLCLGIDNIRNPGGCLENLPGEFISF